MPLRRFLFLTQLPFATLGLACGGSTVDELTTAVNPSASESPTTVPDSGSRAQPHDAGSTGSKNTQGVTQIDPTPAVPGWAVIPSHGGAVVATPHLVLVTFDGDPNRADLEGDAAWLATGGYLASVGAEYGVGNGTLLGTVHVSDAAPTPAGLPAYLSAHLADGSLPAVAPGNIYLLIIPHAAATQSAFCATQVGGHSYFRDQKQQDVVYAYVADCGRSVSQDEVTLSHELVEAATDPTLDGYQIQDPQNPWTYLGGEVGDLCESNARHVLDPSGQYAAALIWSNAAAEKGTTPCGPWPSGSTYFAFSASPTVAQTLAPGAAASFTLTGWRSDAALAGGTPWQFVAEGNQLGDFAPTVSLTQEKISTESPITVTLIVPESAKAGQHGAVWIVGRDPQTGRNVGAIVLAVTAK